MVKAALCFIISYEHKINKESLWKKWIEPNKDILNVYIHYKDETLVKSSSSWIKKHKLPSNFLAKTDYLHVVPAYLCLMHYGLQHDSENQWFCFLTDSCVPIISPCEFRRLFLENYTKSILSWRKAWWNIQFIKRANIHLLKPEQRLANCPWFILNRRDSERCLLYAKINNKIYQTICDGNVANESIFAIMLYAQKSLSQVVNSDSTIADWSRMESATSPHLFKTSESNEKTKDIAFIEDSLKNNKYSIFLRKVDPDFPDEILSNFTKEKKEGWELYQLKMCILFLETRIGFFNFLHSIWSFVTTIVYPRTTH